MANAFALKNFRQLVLHITEVMKFKKCNILLLAMFYQLPLCKHEIRVAYGASIGISIADIHDDILIR